jgi:hypothetical protein
MNIWRHALSNLINAYDNGTYSELDDAIKEARLALKEQMPYPPIEHVPPIEMKGGPV